MIPTWAEPYGDGELRGGWASWDGGAFKDRSIKYAYPDKSGKISRGCPELPFNILVDMVVRAYALGELTQTQVAQITTAFGSEPPQSSKQASVAEYHNPGRTVCMTVGSEGFTCTLSNQLSQEDADWARHLFDTALLRRVK
jgi:hypothetical protein